MVSVWTSPRIRVWAQRPPISFSCLHTTSAVKWHSKGSEATRLQTVAPTQIFALHLAWTVYWGVLSCAFCLSCFIVSFACILDSRDRSLTFVFDWLWSPNAL